MATHFEVFDKLRDMGRSLEKTSNSLPADGNTEDTNKARACLQLKALLTDAKNFKEETSKSIADAKSHYNLKSVLALCQKQTYKLREDIENLEDHLTKYGYKRPTEKFPEIQVDLSEDLGSESSDQCDSESPKRSSSDKENHSPKSEPEQTIEHTDAAEELTKQSHVEEVDLLATPVRPTTVTQFIDNFVQENPASPQPYKEPCPPVTATPFLRSLHPENSGFSTPESLESPAQPATQTPMIKSAINFDSSPEENNNKDFSLVEDFPTPPTFATPGLKRYGMKANSVQSPINYDALYTPPPPSFANVRRLNPDDLCSNSNNIPSQPKLKPSAPLGQSAAQLEQPNKRTHHLPEIDHETYQLLPDSIQRQFSFEQVNVLIKQTDAYLNTRRAVNSTIVTDEELTTVLQLGPFTRAFALVMLKLEYFTVRRSGVYSVHSKTIV